MTHDEVQDWLDRYVEAWRSNQPEAIATLFSDDAVYGYRPWDSEAHTVRGREAIVESWLEEPDAPGSWDAKYEPWAVEGDRAVALGWSWYAASDDQPERRYHNTYLIQFGPEGRCTEFHEFYMEEGK